MAQVQFTPYTTGETSVLRIEKLRGVDLTSDPFQVDPSRSPSAPNMLPGEDGYPQKRRGWHKLLQLSGRVWGGYLLKQADGSYTQLVHAGTTLYRITGEGETLAAEALWQEMADAQSFAVQMDRKLFLLDGKRMLVYDGTKVSPADTMGTPATIERAKSPLGGGVQFAPANMLSPDLAEYFVADGESCDYYLDLAPKSSETVQAFLLSKEGKWQETADFSVEGNVVHFETAPPKAAATGEDSVKITYQYENDPTPLNRCRFGTRFGVNGKNNRLFVSGNSERANQDFYSEFDDGLYFGDLNFGQLGDTSCPITGYGQLGESLVTYKQGEEEGLNIYLRQGALDEDADAQFVISGILQAQGCVSHRACGEIGGEAVYLSNRGVMALASADSSQEKIGQNRSYYLNGQLTGENLAEACFCRFGRFLCIGTKERLYLLDSEQKNYESKEPKSSYQYEGYYFTNIFATALWEADGALWFGRADGGVYRFYTENTMACYSDDDQPINAHWQTPLLDLGSFSQYKKVEGVWVTCQPYSRSGGEIYYLTDKIFEKQTKRFTIDIFNWNDIDFDRFTFNTLDRPVIVPARKKARRVKLFGVCVRNHNLNEPFGIYALQINYKRKGKIRK